ncbi:MAG: hypothetical protein WC663_05145 [Patescibacteria group bacterium]
MRRTILVVASIILLGCASNQEIVKHSEERKCPPKWSLTEIQGVMQGVNDPEGTYATPTKIKICLPDPDSGEQLQFVPTEKE